MSTKTGVAPVYRIDDTVALNVWPTVMTSSPGPRPSPAKMHISATVPLLTAIAWRTPMNSAQRSSSSATRRPPASIPLRRTSVTAAISASSMSGRATGITTACRLAERVAVAVVGVAAAAAGAGELLVRRVAPDLRRRRDARRRPGAGRRRRTPSRSAPPGCRRRARGPGRCRVTTAPAPTIANGPTSQPATTIAPAPIELPLLEADRGDLPVVGPGQLALRRDRARVAVVGEDGARADEHAVRDGHAVIHERRRSGS